MKLKKGELKILYKGKGVVNMEFELEELLKSWGYHRWASGYDLIDGVRDLSFDKRK